MLSCIACTKQTDEDEEEERRGGRSGNDTPSSKDVKSLTAQFKDIALKVCKPCTPSSGYKKGQRHFPDFDTISEGVPYPFVGGSSSSTPAWDFTSSSHYGPGRSDKRFTRAYGGDRTPGGASIRPSCDVVLEDEDEPKEWMAQVEPGVHITFVSLPSGGNDLKRIRFSRDMFNKWEAQRWWGENYDRIMELYNVQRFNQQAFSTPARSEDPRDSSFPRMESARESPMVQREWTSRNHYKPPGSYSAGGHRGESSSMDPSRMTTDSRDDASVSVSNASEMDAEWIEEDAPGVYITIRQLNDGTRELRRVRFSREKFGEVNAKQWWEENRDRIQAQYL